jgi:uncharacterized ParB-like nuclease family protein
MTATKNERTRVPLRLIKPIACTNPERLPHYATLLKAGSKSPPIWLVKQRGKYPYRVFDGAHRLQAAKCAGRKTIAAIVYDKEPVITEEQRRQLAFFGNVRS